MRLSKLMCGVALAGVTLAGSAQAAVVTIKVSGTYTTGSEATLPDDGPIAGELLVETTPYRTFADYTVFEILTGSYIRFGTDDNNYRFNVVMDDSVTYIAQSAANNFVTVSNGDDRFTFQFSSPTSDPTTLYEFASMPVGIIFSPDYNNPEFTYAIGGRLPTGDTRWYPGFNITLTTQAASGAVPEPATWALMIGGFGLAGAALRRRRQAAAAA